MIGHYDYRLVALSVLIAVLASYTALDLAGRTTAARGRVRLSWLAGVDLHCGLMSGANTAKIRRTARKIWCEIDAILYFGRSHEMFLQVWDAFKKQRIVPERDVIKEHQVLMNLTHVSHVGNNRQPEFARE